MSTATVASSTEAQPSKGLHIGLWVVQVLLALAFALAGSGKVSQPLDALAAKMPWVTSVGEPMVRFIGASELLGALGLILPAATRIKPKLTALAGAGLVTIMVLASLFHMSRGEFVAVPSTAVLGGLAAFVAWGRFKKAPIAPR
jgi:uncharacterized membrane protein YphA (DoxX/SURF4 family)